MGVEGGRGKGHACTAGASGRRRGQRPARAGRCFGGGYDMRGCVLRAAGIGRAAGAAAVLRRPYCVLCICRAEGALRQCRAVPGGTIVSVRGRAPCLEARGWVSREGR